MSRAYVDFDLLVEREAQGYRARVLESPAGEASVDFTLPFSPLELENFLLRLSGSLSAARRQIRRLESAERELVEGFGGRLFGAMFTGGVQDVLQASLIEMFRQNSGLRIRLRLTDAPELADVPWEFLFNPESNRFLNLGPDTVLVRYLDLPIPALPLEITPPIQVLVMISSPADYPQLDVEAEWDRLQRALGDLIQRGLVTVTQLPDASLAGLQRPLRLGEYHIVHFIGHGGFDEQSQDGALVLEDTQGRARLVSGQDLGVMLSGHRSLRLIVLNACEGARASSSDPFSGVAQSLVQQGIPAVIAMQFEITDQAAITFSEQLYSAIADGYPVDAALGESRRAIFASGNDVEWATPVLYMRSPDGHLFDVSQSSTGVTPVAPAQLEPEEAGAAVKQEPSERVPTPTSPMAWLKGRLPWVAGAVILLVASALLIAFLVGRHPDTGTTSSPTGSVTGGLPTAPGGVISQGTARLDDPTQGFDLDGGRTVIFTQSNMAWDGSALSIFDETTLGAVNLGRVRFEDLVPSGLRSLRYGRGVDNPPLQRSDIPVGTVIAVRLDETTHAKLQIVGYGPGGALEFRWVTYRD